MQARLQIGATLLQCLERPTGRRAPDMNKRLLDSAVVKRMGPSLCRCITSSLAQGSKQRPPLRGLWRGRLRRIQSPERGCNRQVVPGEALVKVKGIVGSYKRKPPIQHSGFAAQFAADATPSDRLETLVQTPALPEHPFINTADRGPLRAGKTFSHWGLNRYW